MAGSGDSITKVLDDCNPAEASPICSLSAVTSAPFLRVLYVFAGPKRKADIGFFLKEFCAASGVTLELKEIDICRDADDNLLDEGRLNDLLASISSFPPFVGIVTPPCNTFSRAPWANRKGPTPIRCREWPKGFPWLEGTNKIKADAGNELCIAALKILDALCLAGAKHFLEFPEDLGQTFHGGVPSSLWQWEEIGAFAAKSGSQRLALFQCQWPGAASSKPTGLLSNLEPTLFKALGYSGWPRFDKHWKYLGPLPRGCSHTNHSPLIGRGADGNFNTNGVAATPL